MASVNRAIIVGNLGRDPEVRYTAGGSPVANFTVATNERWTDKSGQPQERTEWHRIVVWGKQAETCGQYLKKGRSVYIEGKIQTREWTNKEGQKQYSTEIVATQVQFLGGRSEAGASHGGPDDLVPPSPEFEAVDPGGSMPPGGAGGSSPGGGKSGDDDIPF
jgi:single-strand DNA-binding protein